MNENSQITPNPLQPNGFGGVASDSEVQTPFHTHDGVNSPKLPASVFSTDRGIQMVVFAFTRSVITGDGKFYIHIDERLDGKSLTDVHAEVITAGTTGTTDIQIYNVNNAVDLLSTKLTVDSTETGSDTAATPAVINASNAVVTLNDVLRIDVDAVSTTPPKGLIVTLGFE